MTMMDVIKIVPLRRFLFFIFCFVIKIVPSRRKKMKILILGYAIGPFQNFGEKLKVSLQCIRKN